MSLQTCDKNKIRFLDVNLDEKKCLKSIGNSCVFSILVKSFKKYDFSGYDILIVEDVKDFSDNLIQKIDVSKMNDYNELHLDKIFFDIKNTDNIVLLNFPNPINKIKAELIENQIIFFDYFNWKCQSTQIPKLVMTSLKSHQFVFV